VRAARWLLVVAYLVGGTAFASAGKFCLTFTHPSTNADGTPLTDLRGERVYLIRYPQNQTTYAGEIPGAGREGLRDTFSVLVDDTVHYVGAYLEPIDFSLNAGGKSNIWLAAVPSSQLNLVPGLQATYYDNKDLVAPLYASRVDSAIAFDWDYAAPSPGMGVDTFSIRWEGFLVAPAPGLYAFRAQVEDGCRAWIGDVLGTPICSDWVIQAEHAKTFQAQLAAGQAIPFRFEYFANNGTAAMSLYWTPPGGTERLIPASAFWHVSPGSAPTF